MILSSTLSKTGDTNGRESFFLTALENLTHCKVSMLATLFGTFLKNIPAQEVIHEAVELCVKK
jgi:hypothetical protein